MSVALSPGIRRVVSEVAAGGIRRKCTEQCIAKTVALRQCLSIRSGYERIGTALHISITSITTFTVNSMCIVMEVFLLLCFAGFEMCLPILQPVVLVARSVHPDELGPSLKRRKISKQVLL